jgi:histidinol-phosphate aminotransferase
MSPRPRGAILKVAPYVGGASKLEGVNRVIKLSSNEGAFGPPPAAMAAAIRAAAGMHRYPDGHCTALRQALGARFGLDPAKIVCGAGSDDLIILLIAAYAGEGAEIVMSAHGFSIYEITGVSVGSRVVKVPERDLAADVDAMLAAVSPATRMVFLANPNNPTGSMVPAAEVARLRAGLPPDVMLVIDAAYAEYVERPDYEPGVALVDAGHNTVMTRTFSKIFGMGGLRLGWCYAPPAVVDVLNRVRGPFNVSRSAQEAGIAALAEPGWLEDGRAHNTAERARLAAALGALGLHVWPSEANFLLTDFGSPARAAAADGALRRRGIIVRAVGGYGLPDCLRITIGTTEECDLVIEALTQFVTSSSGAAMQVHA